LPPFVGAADRSSADTAFVDGSPFRSPGPGGTCEDPVVAPKVVGAVELGFSFVPELPMVTAFEFPPAEFPLAVSDWRNEFDWACGSANDCATEAPSEAAFGGGRIVIDVPI
jgi:hypothetical protein